MKMKDSGVEWIGEIPIEWKNAKLKDLSIVYTGNSIKNDEKDKYIYKENTYPYISTKDINLWNQKIDYSDILFIPKENETFKVAKKDSTLICIEGGSAGLKKTFLENDVTFVNKLCCIQPKSIHAKYLFYILISKGFESEFEKNLTGLIPGLSVETLKNISIPVADIFNEQEQIAHFLDDKVSKIDAIITDTKESIEALKAYKQSVITETVTKGLNPDAPMKDSGIEWIGYISENNEVWKLKYLVNERLKYGANETGMEFDYELPRYIRITDIHENGDLRNEGKLSLSRENAEGFLLNEGDILFARSGATVGKTFMFKRCYGESAFAGYLIKATTNTELITAEYLYLYTQSSLYDNWKEQIFIQSTIQNIGADKFCNLPVVLNKDIDEQKKIVVSLNKKINQIDTLIAGKKQLIKEYESYKKSLIYEYVTGKKRVGGEESAG